MSFNALPITPGLLTPDNTLPTTPWLEQMGLHFNPFCALNAADDPHLSEYMVGHEIFAHIWGDWNSWLFARPGGGKTALRIRTLHACWVGQETNRPFPIPYIPPFVSWSSVSPTLDDHLAALSRAGAIALFLALAHRPHWFFRLNKEERRGVRAVLDGNLPGPLNRYLSRCRKAQSIQPLRMILDPTFMLPDPPEPFTLLRWCDSLEAIPPIEASNSPSNHWAQLCDLILDVLKCKGIYILLDGLDGAPETATNARAVVDCLSPLMPCIDNWTGQMIFLKGFLPLEACIPLKASFPELFAPANLLTIRWTPALLAELIRRRIYVASEGGFGSLDAITSPALRDVETFLAKAVIPLPREILVVVQRILEIHMAYREYGGPIQEVEIELALQWYREHQPAISAEFEGDLP